MRGHLVEAAACCSLPAGFSLDMVPILEEDLFGYELTPTDVAETCLTLGCKSDGEPVLRKESLASAVPAALRLATVDGRTIAPGLRAPLSRTGRREIRFPDWGSAARVACDELETLFPGAPRRPPADQCRPECVARAGIAGGRDEARAMESGYPFLWAAERGANRVCAA